MTQDLHYPIGEFDRNFEASPVARLERIKTIAELPKLWPDFLIHSSTRNIALAGGRFVKLYTMCRTAI